MYHAASVTYPTYYYNGRGVGGKNRLFFNDAGYTNYAYEHVAHSETEHLA